MDATHIRALISRALISAKQFSSGWAQPLRRGSGAQEALAQTTAAFHGEPVGSAMLDGPMA